jgi:energy-coupling factor transporter ATP-binding protein EcfA2
MSIEAAIAEWSKARPAWQRTVLRRLASTELLSTSDFTSIADALCAGDEAPEEELTAASISSSSSEPAKVALISVSDLVGVNALVQGEKLSFANTGLTVVYGDNGCGKSGYARLIKSMVSARHRDQILSDVFRETSASSANVDLSINGVRHQTAWPVSTTPDLRRIQFFDRACGDAYVTRDAETTYRPAAIHLIEGLIRVCDGVRAELDAREAKLQVPTKNLPHLKEDSPCGPFMSTLSHLTTQEQINEACFVRPDADGEILRLRTEEGRLLVTDPDKERSRLDKLAADLTAVANHMDACRAEVSDERHSKLEELRRDVAARTQVAETVAARFANQPVRGVGTPAWRALWEAALAFGASQEQDTQTTCAIDGRCVLCHERLPIDAEERLRQFREFVANESQAQLTLANSALKTATRALEGLLIFEPRIEITLERITDHDLLVQACKDELATLDKHRKKMILGEVPDLLSSESVAGRVRESAKDAHGAAAAVPKEGFSKQIAELRVEREALEAQKIVGLSKASVVREVERLRAINRISRAKTEASTAALSRKATELTRAHVTDIMRDRFTREADRLKLERVTLRDLGGQKGSLRHQPGFLGAVQSVPLPSVLSEGEQTALGLAGFFTEVALDSSESTIVLDDPVSSLDHVRRGNVAQRLAEFAQERQ